MAEITFKVGETTYKIRERTQEDFRNGRKIYNKTFNDALSSGSPLQARAADVLKEQGLWTDKKQKELDDVQKEINENEFLLAKGGIKKSEARLICFKLSDLRFKKLELLAPITNFNRHTAEGQADNARFDYWVSVCLVYEDGRPYFNSYEEYLNSTDDVASTGAVKAAELFYELDENFEFNLPENKVLKECGFVDDKFRLINSKDQLIDREGNLVNENGERVNDKGELVNIYGKKIDKEGNFVIDKKPFLDD